MRRSRKGSIAVEDADHGPAILGRHVEPGEVVMTQELAIVDFEARARIPFADIAEGAVSRLVRGSTRISPIDMLPPRFAYGATFNRSIHAAVKRPMFRSGHPSGAALRTVPGRCGMMRTVCRHLEGFAHTLCHACDGAGRSFRRRQRGPLSRGPGVLHRTQLCRPCDRDGRQSGARRTVLFRQTGHGGRPAWLSSDHRRSSP